MAREKDGHARARERAREQRPGSAVCGGASTNGAREIVRERDRGDRLHGACVHMPGDVVGVDAWFAGASWTRQHTSRPRTSSRPCLPRQSRVLRTVGARLGDTVCWYSTVHRLDFDILLRSVKRPGSARPPRAPGGLLSERVEPRRAARGPRRLAGLSDLSWLLAHASLRFPMRRAA